MSDVHVQVCVRQKGEETCPYHPGHKISSLCRTCQTLVCLECIQSPDHEGHTIKKIKECLQESTDKISNYISDINNSLLKGVEKELDEVKKERNESADTYSKNVKQIQDQTSKFKSDIDNTTDVMKKQLDDHFRQMLKTLDKHIEALEKFKSYLTQETKESINVLSNHSPGSEILKYDTAEEKTQKSKDNKIPVHPPILPKLVHVECDDWDALIQKAMGGLREMCKEATIVKPKSNFTSSPSKHLINEKRFSSPPDSLETPFRSIPLMKPKLDEKPRPQSYSDKLLHSTTTTTRISADDILPYKPKELNILTSFDNHKCPSYYGFTPIGRDTAWAGEYLADQASKDYNQNSNRYCQVLYFCRGKISQISKLDLFTGS